MTTQIFFDCVLGAGAIVGVSMLLCSLIDGFRYDKY